MTSGLMPPCFGPWLMLTTLCVVVIITCFFMFILRKHAVLEHMLRETKVVPKSPVSWLLFSDVPNEKGNVSTLDKADFAYTDALSFDKLETRPTKSIVLVTPHISKFLILVTNQPRFHKKSVTSEDDIVTSEDAVSELKAPVIPIDKLDIAKSMLVCQDVAALAATRNLLALLGLPLPSFMFVNPDVNAVIAKHTDVRIIFSALTTESHPDLFATLSALTGISMVDYGELLDVHKLGVSLPYAKVTARDMRMLMPTKSQFSKIMKVVTFDTLVYSKEDPSQTPDANLKASLVKQQFLSKIESAQERRETVLAGNFYEKQGFNVAELKQTHEGFSNGPMKSTPVTLTPPENIKGKLVKSVRNIFNEFHLESNRVQGVELNVGDKIILNHQMSSIENGNYFVASLQPLVLKTAINVDAWTGSKIVDKNDKANTYTITVPRSTFELPETFEILQMPVYIKEMDMPGFITEANGKTVTIVVKDDLVALQGEYKCVTDERAMTQAACESMYDVQGNAKTHGKDIWDRPCKWDNECPFWTFSKTASAYRGGCNNGFCELPVNVKRKGYRKYELSPESYPYCHGCDLFSMAECCAKKSKEDYAFELDFAKH